MKKLLLTLSFFIFITSTKAQVCFRNAGDYTAGISPGVLASGDFNNDRLKDLAVVDTYGDLHIYFKSTSQKFIVKNVISTLWKNVFSIIAEDFNHDSLCDLAFSAYYSDTIYVLQSKGDGSFNTKKVNVPTGAHFLCSGDFNNDHFPDLLAQGDSLSFFACDGAGNFSQAITSYFGSGGSIKSAQLNADSIRDIIHYSESGTKIMLGDGSGHFYDYETLPSSYASTDDFVSADFSGDGLNDIALLHNNWSVIELFLNNGSSFSSWQTYSTLSPPQFMATADFNKDGKVDLFASDGSLFMGNGNGLSSKPLNIPLKNYGLRLLCDDFNNDSYPDVIVEAGNASGFSEMLTSTGITDVKLTVVNPVCPGDYSSISAKVSGNGAPFKYLWDNNDSATSIIKYGESGGYLLVTASDGCQMRSYFSISYITPFSIQTSSKMIGCGSQKNDVILNVSGARPPYTFSWSSGQKDSIAYGLSSGKYVVSIRDSANCLINDSIDIPVAINFSPLKKYDANASKPNKLIKADLNGDQLIDLISGNLNSISVFINNGVVGFANAASYAIGSNLNVNDIHVADINNDKHTDILVSSGTSIYAFIANDNYTFGSPIVVKTLGGKLIKFDCADINGDKKIDMVCFVEQGGTINIMRGNGDGTFTDISLLARYPDNVLLIDFDGDSNVDIVSSEYGELIVAFGNGTGAFANFAYYGNAWGQFFLKAADYNSDGILDIISGGDGRITHLRGKGNSKFAQPVLFLANNDFNILELGDLNADGYAFDVVAGNTSNGLITIMQTDTAGKVHLQTIVDIKTRVSALAVADFNNDGKHDMAVALPDSNSIVIYSNCSALGLKEISNDNSLMLYPNPSEGVINIATELSENAQIEVLNLNGQIVKQVSGHMRSLDLKSMPEGMYLIRISDSDRNYHAKIIIDR